MRLEHGKGTDKVKNGDRLKVSAEPATGKNQRDLLKGIVHDDDVRGFLAFAEKRPRLLIALSKGELGEPEKTLIGAAYADFKAERVAIVKSEAAAVSARLGIPEEEAMALLETHTNEAVGALVLVAQREGLEARDVVRIDSALLEDGCYIDRQRETLTVSIVHGRLTKMVNAELERHAGRTAVRAEDEGLDNLWAELVKKHEGNEDKAAAEYAKAAEERLLGARGAARSARQFELEVETVVELFKLFNYDRPDLEAFLEYVEHKFELVPGCNADDAMKLIFERLLPQYVKENSVGLVLNDRSSLYRKIVRAHIGSLVMEGMLELGALADSEIASSSDEEPIVNVEAEEEDEGEQADEMKESDEPLKEEDEED